MNRISTTIGWADFALNPYPGCWGPGGTSEKPKWCPYCYARRIAERFRGTAAWPNGFDPTPRLGRLEELGHIKKPSIIFMGDAGDIFGAWVPPEDIRHIITATQIAPSHTYLFLTKNPARYAGFTPWPPNCWLGVAVTGNRMFQEAFDAMCHLNARIRFLSIEPLLSPLLIQGDMLAVFNWLVIGCETGRRPDKVTPRREWIEEIEGAADRFGIPIWEKDSREMRALLGRPLRQERPDFGCSANAAL